MKTQELISYLDTYLKNSEFTDSSKNGLQIETQKEEIKKIGLAVDSTTYLAQQAADQGVDLLLTHHGLFRGYDQPLTGVMYQRTKIYLENDLGLYACHLPLDAHPEVGNNAGLAQAWCNLFGIIEYDQEPFGGYGKEVIGTAVRFESKIPTVGILTPYCERMGLQRQFLNFGKHEYISSVAFVSGGGGGAMIEAHEKGIDLFITGEMVHRQTTLAKELGQSVLLGGHYETEKIGVKLLGKHLEKKFGVETVFLDEKR